MADEINNIEEYTQSIDYTNNEAGQHDLPTTKTLYYSSKDPDNPRNLYLDERGAEGKTAEVNANYFPTDIIWMYIYGFIKEGNDYKQVLFRITYPQNFVPTRRQVKKLLDLIDYIELYRPKNGIKWYTISRKQFDERIGILNSYWGMNLPTKTGEYRYSKKVNKWLASTEFEQMAYNGIVDIDFYDLLAITNGGTQTGTSKTLLEIINERIQGIFSAIGNFFKGFFSGDWFDENKFAYFWQGLTKDENGNWIPDSLEHGLDKVFTLDFSKLGLDRNNRNMKQWFDDSIADIKAKFNIQSSGSGIFASIWNDTVLPWIKNTLNWNWWD